MKGRFVNLWVILVSQRLKLDSLRQRFLFAGTMNFLLAPFLVTYFLIVFLMRNLHVSSIGPRSSSHTDTCSGFYQNAGAHRASGVYAICPVEVPGIQRTVAFVSDENEHELSLRGGVRESVPEGEDFSGRRV